MPWLCFVCGDWHWKLPSQYWLPHFSIDWHKLLLVVWVSLIPCVKLYFKCWFLCLLYELLLCMVWFLSCQCIADSIFNQNKNSFFPFLHGYPAQINTLPSKTIKISLAVLYVWRSSIAFNFLTHNQDGVILSCITNIWSFPLWEMQNIFRYLLFHL